MLKIMLAYIIRQGLATIHICDYSERHVTVVSMQASFHVFHFLFPLQWRWTPKEGLAHFIWQSNPCTGLMITSFANYIVRPRHLLTCTKATLNCWVKLEAWPVT